MPTFDFEDDFESGSLAAYTEVGSPAIETAAPLAGANSLAVAATNATEYIEQSIPAGVQVASWVFKFKAVSIPSGTTPVLTIRRGTQNVSMRLASNGRLSLIIGVGAIQNGPILTAGQEVTIDLLVNTSANPYTADWYVDGVSYPQATHTLSAGDITVERIGNHSAAGTTYDFLYDDVKRRNDATFFPLSAAATDYEESLSLTGAATPTLSADQAEFPETTSATVTATPTLSGEVYTPAAAETFNTSFECAALADLGGTITGSQLSLATDRALEGAQSLKVVANATAASHIEFSRTGDVLVGRLRVQMDAFPSGGAWNVFQGAGDKNFTIGINTTGRLFAQVQGGTIQLSTVKSTDTTYVIDFRFDSSGSTYTIDWAIDGVDQTQATGAGVAGADITAWRFGNANNLSTITGWIDSLRVAESGALYKLDDSPLAYATETLSATASCALALSAETFLAVETLNATGTATLALPSQLADHVETLTATGTATLTFAAEDFVAGPGEYVETVGLTATASVSLSSELHWITETLTAAATAPPTLAAASALFPDALSLSAATSLSLASDIFGAAEIIETLTAAAAATGAVPSATLVDNWGQTVIGTDNLFSPAGDTAYTSKITALDDGTMTHLAVYCDGKGAGVGDGGMKLVIYSVDGSGLPETYLGETVNVAVTDGQDAGWVVLALESELAHSVGDQFWIGPHVSATNPTTIRFHRHALTQGNRFQTDDFSDGTAATWTGTAVQSGGFQFSVYARSTVTEVEDGAVSFTETRSLTITATPTLADEFVPPPASSTGAWDAVVIRTGSATSGVTGTTSQLAANPWLRGAAVSAGWDDLEPTYRGYVWPTAWENSFLDAYDRGAKIIPRIFAGGTFPSWMYSNTAALRGGHPKVETMETISREGQGARLVPVPWDPTLAVHYVALLQWLNTRLQRPLPGGRSGTYADVVMHVPITLPTEQGSEMPIGYGGGTWTGTYKGVPGTYNVAATNRAEWLAHSNAPAGSSDAVKQARNQADLEQAWLDAVGYHITHLQDVQSSLAIGGFWNDNHAAAGRIVRSQLWADNKLRLWCFSTNLRTGPNAPYTWRSWNPKAAEIYDYVRSIGGICGFQTASPENMGPDPVPGETGDMADAFRHAALEGRDEFDTHCLEVSSVSLTPNVAWLRDVYQPSIIHESAAVFIEFRFGLTATATPSLASEVVESSATEFFDDLSATATVTGEVTSEVLDAFDHLVADATATLALPTEGLDAIETLDLLAEALNAPLLEVLLTVETLDLTASAGLTLASEDTGHPTPPPDMDVIVSCYNTGEVVSLAEDRAVVEILSDSYLVEI